MTEGQHRHVHALMSQSNKLMEDKYAKGAEQHGGNLWDMDPLQLLDNAIDEAVDQVVYLLTLKEAMKNGSRD